MDATATLAALNDVVRFFISRALLSTDELIAALPSGGLKEKDQRLATLVAAGHTPVGRELVARVSARRKFSDIRTYFPWGRPCFHVLSE